MPGLKKLNEYVYEIPEYPDIPKAVWAAIAISFAKMLEPEDWKEQIWDEWETLYHNGIIQQKPIEQV